MRDKNMSIDIKKIQITMIQSCSDDKRMGRELVIGQQSLGAGQWW